MNKKAKAIRINEKWCKCCGICVEFCPRKVFSMENSKIPAVVHLINCTVCRMCEMRCPDYAMIVEEDNRL